MSRADEWHMEVEAVLHRVERHDLANPTHWLPKFLGELRRLAGEIRVLAGRCAEGALARVQEVGLGQPRPALAGPTRGSLRLLPAPSQG